MRSNAWTTVEECKFLDDLIPQFLSQQEIRVVGPWLTEIATTFFANFPSRSTQFDRDRMTKKIRTWFGNHTRDCVKGTDARNVIDLSGKAHRRPLPLQSSQAYSALYYREGTPVYCEIKNLYELYKAGDAATLLSLRGLFEQLAGDDPNTGDNLNTSGNLNTGDNLNTATTRPNPEATPDKIQAPPKTARRQRKKDTTTTQPETATPQPDEPPPPPEQPTKKKPHKSKKKKATNLNGGHTIPPFVHFQQTIIREKLKTISDEEAAAIERHIEDTYATAMKIWERPWLSLMKSGGSEDELESEYYTRNANRLSHSLQVASEEVTRQSLFRTFFMWGGPSSVAGTVDILSTQTGCTVEGEQDFTSFLGPMFGELQEKFRQWLQLTYTQEELHRKPPTKTTPQLLDASRSMSVTPPPAPAPVLLLPETPSIAATPTPTIQPSPSPTTPLSTPSSPNNHAAATLDFTNLNTFDIDPDTMNPIMTNPGPVTPTNATGPTTSNPSIVNPTTSDPSTISPTTADVNPENVDGPNATDTDVSLSPTMSNPGTANPGSSPLMSGATSPAIATGTPLFDHNPSSQDIFDPTMLALVKACPSFVTPEIVQHLLSVSNVDGWSDLIQIYLKFEAASPSKNATRLPAKGHPPEVDQWLKDQTSGCMSLLDTAGYAEAWMGWWIGSQPPGRAAATWPFSREPLLSIQWGRLLNGGKNGIFLFVMALSWWAKSLGPTTSSPDLTGAVADVEWVLRQLTNVLTTPLAPEPATEVALETEYSGRSKRKIVLTEKALHLSESIKKRYRR